MKKCPYCAEDILDDAVKCKHCGEFFRRQKNARWYYSTTTWVIAFLMVGPFALPLVWKNPNYSLTKKIVISIFIGIITLIFIKLFLHTWSLLEEYYKVLL